MDRQTRRRQGIVVVGEAVHADFDVTNPFTLVAIWCFERHIRGG